jgi:hypothetical protein
VDYGTCTSVSGIFSEMVNKIIDGEGVKMNVYSSSDCAGAPSTEAYTSVAFPTDCTNWNSVALNGFIDFGSKVGSSEVAIALLRVGCQNTFIEDFGSCMTVICFPFTLLYGHEETQPT